MALQLPPCCQSHHRSATIVFQLNAGVRSRSAPRLKYFKIFYIFFRQRILIEYAMSKMTHLSALFTTIGEMRDQAESCFVDERIS